MVIERKRGNLFNCAKIFFVFGFGNLIILLLEILLIKNWSEQIDLLVNLIGFFTALLSIILWGFMLFKVKLYKNEKEKHFLKLSGYIIILYYFVDIYFSFIYKSFYLNRYTDNVGIRVNFLKEISINMGQMTFDLRIFLFVFILVALLLLLHKDRFFWIGAIIIVLYFTLRSIPDEIARIYIDRGNSISIPLDALFSKLINSLGYIVISIYFSLSKNFFHDNLKD